MKVLHNNLHHLYQYTFNNFRHINNGHLTHLYSYIWSGNIKYYSMKYNLTDGVLILMSLSLHNSIVIAIQKEKKKEWQD